MGIRNLSCLFTAVLGLVTTTAAQGSQLVGPVLDVGAVVRAAPGFSGANSFAGACRDAQGNYWTACKVGNQVLFVRIAPTGTVSSAVLAQTMQNTQDMAYDRIRNRLWVSGQIGYSQSFIHGVEVIDLSTGAMVWSYSNSATYETRALASRGIAWNGADRVLIGASNQNFAAASPALVTDSGPANPAGESGYLYHPPTNSHWVGNLGSIDVATPLTASYIREYPASGSASSTMTPDLALVNSNDSLRGGRQAGMEAWQDLTTGEWLGVFLQVNDVGDARLYTARLSTPTGPGCGPVFRNGPAVVQDNIYAGGGQVGVLAWLMVSLQPGTFNDPLLGTGCTIHLEPQSAIALGPFLSTAGGQIVVGRGSIPVQPAFRELPLWFQWATVSFAGEFRVSEARSAAIKQY